MFCVKSKDQRIINATKKVMFLLSDKRFMNKMRVGHPDMSNCTAAKIEALVTGWVTLQDIEVCTYRPWYWWSKARARYQSKRPNTVQLSSRGLNRYRDKEENEASISGSIVHEIVHLVDDKFDEYSFGHGGNSSKVKENTAPYRWGREAKKHILENY